MGTASRNTKAREIRVKLSGEEFHKLISKLRHVEVLRLEAREKAATLDIVQKEIAGVEGEGKAMFEGLAKKYGFDAGVGYRFDETTCELVAVAPAPVGTR